MIEILLRDFFSSEWLDQVILITSINIINDTVHFKISSTWIARLNDATINN